VREQILTLALGMTSASGEDQVLLETLCSAAEAAWRARLKSGVLAETCREAFCCAAAFTAAADFLAGKNGERVDSFTAGEISIKGKSGADADSSADALRRTAERLMTPYAEVGSFAFKGVRG